MFVRSMCKRIKSVDSQTATSKVKLVMYTEKTLKGGGTVNLRGGGAVNLRGGEQYTHFTAAVRA